MQSTLRPPLRALGLCLVLITASGITQFAFAASDPSVTIIDFDFQPAVMTVNPGDTVMWTNSGNVSHTTTSDKPLWDSSSLPTGGTFSFHFTTPGTFSYHCNIHPGMRGLIFVPGAPGDQPTASDGHQLSMESAATQMLFSATWGTNAALEWVREHDAALAGHPIGGGGSSAGAGGAPSAPSGPSAPAGPAPAAPAPAAPAPAAPPPPPGY